MSSTLLVVGSVAYDTIETHTAKREEILGGAATFIALSASHLCAANVVAVVGEDDFPQTHIDLLTRRGINLDGLERAPGRTFRWAGRYADDFSSRTTLDTQLGVFETFDPKIPEAYRANRYLMLGNIHPALQLKVLDGFGDDTFVAADTMNLWIDTTRELVDALLKRVDLLIINDEEALMLTGERQILPAANKIRAMGPPAVIIKRGEHGAYLFTESVCFFAPALPLAEVVDPTGAGDSFAGGLLGYLAAQDSTGIEVMKTGMLYGAAAASIKVGLFGADEFAAVNREEIDRRVGQLRELVRLGG